MAEARRAAGQPVHELATATVSALTWTRYAAETNSSSPYLSHSILNIQDFCSMSDVLLTDIRILDLSRVLAGPYCTMVLADYGAEVIKVEEPGSGDGTRAWGPPWVGDQSAYFLAANRNKRSITVNLKTTEGRQLIHALAARSDVGGPQPAPRLLFDHRLRAERAVQGSRRL
jgi:hypothetical protein